MDREEKKCVLVADAALPPGVLANLAAILGITLGTQVPGLTGPAVTDASGSVHPGIITMPIPVLKSDAEGLRALRGKLGQPAFHPVFAADFSDVAQKCRTYPEYLSSAAQTPESDFTYLALLLRGPKALVNKLTGSLPLLR